MAKTNSQGINTAYVAETRQPQILRETIPLIVLAVLAVAARFLCIRIKDNRVSVDDYTIVAVLVSSSANFALVVLDTHLGLGKHTAIIPKRNVKLHYKVVFASSIIYATSITLAKVAILLLYKRLFPGPKITLGVRIICSVALAWWLSVLAIQVFFCVPLNGFWDFNIHARCHAPERYYLGVAVPNILIDVVTLCFPVPVVLRLELAGIKKLGVILSFLTGAFVIVASGYRVSLFNQANRIDPLWSYTDIAIWSSIEPSVAVISACLPTLRPLCDQACSLAKRLRCILHFARTRPRDRVQILLETITEE